MAPLTRQAAIFVAEASCRRAIIRRLEGAATKFLARMDSDCSLAGREDWESSSPLMDFLEGSVGRNPLLEATGGRSP